MRVFFDASAFAKRYIAEQGSDRVDAICADASALGLCVLCAPEIISALNRRIREGTLRLSGYQEVKEALAVDVRDAEIIDLMPRVIGLAVQLLEENALRAADTLHVAAAIHWDADVFVSADGRQLAAARRAGLATREV